jgi:protein-tyrosine phosphatase
MVRVLLVCTGNVCRSPLAEGILRKLVRDAGSHGAVVVESAGTAAVEGAHASGNSVEVAARAGIDIRGHAARQLTKRLVSRSNLILTMQPEHRDWIVGKFPEAAEKTHVVTRYVDASEDSDGVQDPIGLDIDAYQETFEKIEESLRAAMPRILDLIPEGTGPTTKRAT